MILLANGCSHTAGAELEFPMQPRCYSKAWPQHLADTLGYEHENLSNSGASCHRIVRTTMRYILDFINDKRSLKDLFVVVAWPGPMRIELRKPLKVSEEEKHLYFDENWLPLVLGNDSMYKKQFTPKLYYHYKSWVVTMDEIGPILDYLHYIIMLQNFLLLHKIKYRFYSAAHVSIDRSHPELIGYRALINKKYYPHFGKQEMMLTNLLKRNGQQVSPYSIESGFASHYDEYSQFWLANYLYEEIKSER